MVTHLANTLRRLQRKQEQVVMPALKWISVRERLSQSQTRFTLNALHNQHDFAISSRAEVPASVDVNNKILAGSAGLVHDQICQAGSRGAFTLRFESEP